MRVLLILHRLNIAGVFIHPSCTRKYKQIFITYSSLLHLINADGRNIFRAGKTQDGRAITFLAYN